MDGESTAEPLKLDSPDGFNATKNLYFNLLAAEFKHTGQIQARSVIFTHTDPDTLVVNEDVNCLVELQLDMEDSTTKDMSAAMLKATQEALSGFCTIFIAESFVLRLDVKDLAPYIARGLSELDANYQYRADRGWLNLRDCPKSEELVLVIIDHHADKKGATYVAKITREIPGDWSSKGTLEAFTLQDGELTGRFSTRTPMKESN